MVRRARVEVSVVVPRSVNGVIALGRALSAAAEGEVLPEAIAEALEAVEGAHGDLTEVAARRLLEAAPADARPVAEAHRAAWRALERWASSWLEGPLPAAEAERAARIFAVVDDGVALQRLSHGDAWVEAGHRLERLARLEDDFAALGGAAFLRVVRDAHRALGEAAKVTIAPPLALPLVRAPLDALREAVKRYVLQVSAHGLRGEAGAELEARLLAPFEHLAPRRRRKRGAALDADAPAPRPAADAARDVEGAAPEAPASERPTPAAPPEGGPIDAGPLASLVRREAGARAARVVEGGELAR